MEGDTGSATDPGTGFVVVVTTFGVREQPASAAVDTTNTQNTAAYPKDRR
jgi:hypothetical protein